MSRKRRRGGERRRSSCGIRREFAGKELVTAMPLRTAAAEKPEWLPEGWMVECRKRGNSEQIDKYYICPFSRQKLRSRLEVMRYLNNRVPDQHAAESEHGAHNQLISYTDANRPAWLPEGWTVEIRKRRTISYNNRSDKYYICPLSHKKLRSRLEVMRYLNNRMPDRPASKSKHGGYNQVVSLADANRPAWLPEGWTMEIRKRKIISYHNQADKYYISPSGEKLRSRLEVMRYLNTKMMLDHPASGSAHGGLNLLPADEDKLLGWLPNGWNSEVPLQMIGESPGKSHKAKTSEHSDGYQTFTQIEHSPSGLPHGWIKETRVRKNGGRTDSYYIDPINGYEFRSKLDAFRYLENRGARRITYRQLRTHTPEAYSLAEEFLPLAALRRPKVKRTAVRKHLFSGEKPISNESLEIVIANPTQQPASPSLSHVSSKYNGFGTSFLTPPIVGPLKQGNFQTTGQLNPEFQEEELKPQRETDILSETVNEVSNTFMKVEGKSPLYPDANNLLEDKQSEITKKKILYLHGEEHRGQREIKLLLEPENMKHSETLIPEELKEKQKHILQVPLHGEELKGQTKIKMSPESGKVKPSKALVQVKGKNLQASVTDNLSKENKIELTKNQSQIFPIPSHGDELKGNAEFKMLPELGNEKPSNTLIHVEGKNINLSGVKQSEVTKTQSHNCTEAITSASCKPSPRKKKAINPITGPDQASKRPAGFAAFAVPDFRMGDLFIRTNSGQTYCPQPTVPKESDTNCLLNEIEKDLIAVDEAHEKDRVKEPHTKQTVERNQVDLHTHGDLKLAGDEANAVSKFENADQTSSRKLQTATKEKPISNSCMAIVIANPLQEPASLSMSHDSSESDVGSEMKCSPPANVAHMEQGNFHIRSHPEAEFLGKEIKQQTETKMPPELGNEKMSDVLLQLEGKSLVAPDANDLSEEEHLELTEKQNLYRQNPLHGEELVQMEIKLEPEPENMKPSETLVQAELKEKQSHNLQMLFHGEEQNGQTEIKMPSESRNVELSKSSVQVEGKNLPVSNTNTLSLEKKFELANNQSEILQIPFHGDELKGIGEIEIIPDTGNDRTSNILIQEEGKNLDLSKVKQPELTKKQSQRNDTEAITSASRQPSPRKIKALKIVTGLDWASKRPIGFAAYAVSDFRMGDGFRITNSKQADKIQKDMFIDNETNKKYKRDKGPLIEQTVKRKKLGDLELAGVRADAISDLIKGDFSVRTNSRELPIAVKERSMTIVIGNLPPQPASSSLSNVSSECDGLAPPNVGDLEQRNFQIKSQFNPEYHGEEFKKQMEFEMPQELENEQLSNSLMQNLSEHKQIELTKYQTQILQIPSGGEELNGNSEIEMLKKIGNEEPSDTLMQVKGKNLPAINNEAITSVSSQPNSRKRKALKEIDWSFWASKRQAGFAAFAVSDFRSRDGFGRTNSEQTDQIEKDVIVNDEIHEKDKEVKEPLIERTLERKTLGAVSDFEKSDRSIGAVSDFKKSDRSITTNSRELPTVTKEFDARGSMHQNEKDMCIADELQKLLKIKEHLVEQTSHNQQVHPNTLGDSWKNSCKLAGCSSHQFEKDVSIIDELKERLKINVPLVKQDAKEPKFNPHTCGTRKRSRSRGKSSLKDNHSQPTVLKGSGDSYLVHQIDKDMSITNELKEKLKIKEPLLERASPFVECWTDPCLEFAFKTLTSDSLVLEEDYFKDPWIQNLRTGLSPLALVGSSAVCRDEGKKV